MSDGSSDVYLGNLSEAWREASDSGGLPPHGVYRIQTIDSRLRYANGTQPWFDLIGEILEGDQTGRKIIKSYILKTNTLWALKTDCKTMGRPVADIEELSEHQFTLLGIEMDWVVGSRQGKDGKTYSDIQITKVYGTEPPPAAKPNPRPAPAARPRGNEPPPPSDQDAPDNW